MRHFTSNYPHLVEKFLLHIKEKPVNLEHRHLLEAENQLADCANCKEGEMCLEKGFWDAAGDLKAKSNPGVAPASIDSNGCIFFEPCKKWVNMQRSKKLLKMGIPKLFQNSDFDTFKPKNRSQEKALNACRKFVKEVSSGNETVKGLFFNGPYGTGKTHLSAAAMIELSDLGINSLCFKNVPKLLSSARKEISRQGQDIKRDPLESAAQASIIVLDDIGAEKISEWVREQLFLLINERYESQAPTIITTNANLSDLENRIGGAAVSRIWQMCQGYLVDGPDHRQLGGRN